MRRVRTVNEPRPVEVAKRDGLSYSLWLPASGRPLGGVVILHGAGSCKESHHDFARALLAAGFAAIAFDQRGHGDSDGSLDAGALHDVQTIAGVLRTSIGEESVPLALRGSSMGGFIAILAAEPVGADAVVAICPASAEGLARGISSGRFEFQADADALTALLEQLDLPGTVERLTVPLLILHAEGDEQVPVQHSQELAKHLAGPPSRLIVVPGGHHRSIQHDGELQAVSLRWLAGVLAR